MAVLVPPPGEVLQWLGGPIDIRVEVDTGLEGTIFGLWDSAVWDTGIWGDTDPLWADATPYIFQVEISAGTQRWGERVESASASILVDNTEGIFTPESGVDHWHLPFHPGRRIRVVAIPDASTGEKVPLFTGQIDSTTDLYDDAGHALTTSIVCSDFMSRWSAHNPLMLDVPTGVQSTSERVHAALDRMDWPVGERIVATGLHSMQTSFLAQSTLEECQKAADAEGSIFYSDRLGNAVFKARDWLTTDPRSIDIQGFLGYDEVPEHPTAGLWNTDVWDTGLWLGFIANTAHILSIETSWEAARVVNHAAFARAGSSLQVVEDATSVGAYGRRSYQRTDYENSEDSETLFLAERYVTAFKDSRMRVDAVTITAIDDADDEDRNRLLWDTRFGDRLILLIDTPNGWSFEKEVHVMALAHHITASDWTVTLQLDDAQTYEGT